MSFLSPFADVDISDIGVYEYVFGDIADADLNRIALVGLSYADVVLLDGPVDPTSDLGCRTMADMLSSGTEW